MLVIIPWLALTRHNRKSATCAFQVPGIDNRIILAHNKALAADVAANSQQCAALIQCNMPQHVVDMDDSPLEEDSRCLVEPLRRDSIPSLQSACAVMAMALAQPAGGRVLLAGSNVCILTMLACWRVSQGEAPDAVCDDMTQVWGAKGWGSLPDAEIVQLFAQAAAAAPAAGVAGALPAVLAPAAPLAAPAPSAAAGAAAPVAAGVPVVMPADGAPAAVAEAPAAAGQPADAAAGEAPPVRVGVKVEAAAAVVPEAVPAAAAPEAAAAGVGPAGAAGMLDAAAPAAAAAMDMLVERVAEAGASAGEQVQHAEAAAGPSSRRRTRAAAAGADSRLPDGREAGAPSTATSKRARLAGADVSLPAQPGVLPQQVQLAGTPLGPSALIGHIAATTLQKLSQKLSHDIAVTTLQQLAQQLGHEPPNPAQGPDRFFESCERLLSSMGA